MVIVMDMQSGERAVAETTVPQAEGGLMQAEDWRCPTQVPKWAVDERKQVLPALMEHTFTVR